MSQSQKERKKETSAKWRSENLNKAKEAIAKWRAENRERIKEYEEKYRAKTKDRKRELNIKWAAANPCRVKANKAKWVANNREKISKNNHSYRARKFNVTIGETKVITKWEKGWRKNKIVACYWCGAKVAGKAAHADHIIPLSKAGTHSVENLCISCSGCNQSKHAKTLEQWNKTLTQPVLL